MGCFSCWNQQGAALPLLTRQCVGLEKRSLLSCPPRSRVPGPEEIRRRRGAKCLGRKGLGKRVKTLSRFSKTKQQQNPYRSAWGGGVPGVRTQEDPRLSTQGEGWPCPFLPPPYLIRLGGGSLGSRRPGPHLQLDRPVGDPLFVCMQ